MAASKKSDREARERARVYQARQDFQAGLARRKRRDNLVAGIGGGLIIVGLLVGQGVYFTSGPGAPVPTPSTTSTPGESTVPTPGESVTPNPSTTPAESGDPSAEPDSTDSETPTPDVTPAPEQSSEPSNEPSPGILPDPLPTEETQ